eukprot:gnl/TRDRNA2_/TRDRNA2_48111_c0_seq2.p1 gnl/TRDRNA2_/TRDRNA2_48111_c0~~gnl/TRDRNA2_/TRDRNA2_48111_c0_seq2.p1  ORF type:complete len:248 (+),score=37.56 gnl/TRDRNA2_/TRDRNA2_48111_c0_seq2:13-756(+)
MALEVVLNVPGLGGRISLHSGPVAAHRLLLVKPSMFKRSDFPLGSWEACHSSFDSIALAKQLLEEAVSSPDDAADFLDHLYLLTLRGVEVVEGHTLLDIAVDRRLRCAIPLLRMRGDVLRYFGELSIESAVRANDRELVAAHLDAGVAVDARINAGRSPLMVAASASAQEVLQLLLVLDADVNRQSCFGGWTALMWAAHVGWEDGCRALMAAGASLEERNQHGMRALDIAERNGHANVVETLCAGTL